MTKHNTTAYYDAKLDIGLEFQDFVAKKFMDMGMPIITHSSRKSQLNGENTNGFEIKRDGGFRKSGNLFIETSERPNILCPNFKPSGIYRDDNTWLYVIGDEKTFYIFSLKYLVNCHESKKYREVHSAVGTSYGFLLPIKDATPNALKIWGAENAR